MAQWDCIDGPETLRLTHSGGALRIELHRPGRLNAFDSAAQSALLDVLRGVASDDTVRSVLITGAGRAFSAGADIGDQFSTDEARSVIEQEMRELSGPTIAELRALPKPVIAAVNGAAAGIGCSIALAADLVLAAESSFFLLAFANIGLMPDGGASLMVPARVGLGRAMTLAMLAERLPAAEAVQWGLADRLVADADLAATAEDLALRLAAGPTRAYAATKAAMNRAVLRDLDEILELEAVSQGALVGSADFREGTTAFMEKRPARFSGA